MLVLNKAAACPRRPSVAFSDFARPSPAPPPFHRALAGRTEALSSIASSPSTLGLLKWGGPPADGLLVLPHAVVTVLVFLSNYSNLLPLYHILASFDSSLYKVDLCRFPSSPDFKRVNDISC